MPKYLVNVSYTASGAQGLLKDGGSKRRAAADAAIRKLGGSIECFYFSFGASDAIVVASFPDAVSAAALSVAIAASGSVRTSTTELLTVEQMDEACRKQTGYTPPGA